MKLKGAVADRGSPHESYPTRRLFLQVDSHLKNNTYIEKVETRRCNR
jgi:hypothetical protein